MLFQWACSGTPGGGRCFPDHRFLASCHLLGTLSPNDLGSLVELFKVCIHVSLLRKLETYTKKFSTFDNN